MVPIMPGIPGIAVCRNPASTLSKPHVASLCKINYIIFIVIKWKMDLGIMGCHILSKYQKYFYQFKNTQGKFIHVHEIQYWLISESMFCWLSLSIAHVAPCSTLSFVR